MNGMKKDMRVELLAPAGGMRALEAVLHAGADAVYLSGKRFGMRGHRASFHFDDRAMKEAVAATHALGARIYVTVNNLLTDGELKSALDYVAFLARLGADAVIVQDLGLLERLHASPPGLEIHVSTMMNVHSSPFAAFLKNRGVSRVITSRDITLGQASEMARRTGLAVEYFVHGDMCSVQSGLCHLSGVLFGQSANRGRCLKPCRWSWKLAEQGREPGRGASRHLMARKDICLLHALPTVLESGIAALKIEGRMRPAEFLEELVGIYRRAMDRYSADPFGYREDPEDAERLFRLRVRDFSSCHAFGQRGALSMGFTGSREPKHFSHPVRSNPLAGPALKADPLPERLPAPPPVLAAALVDPEALDAVLSAGPDWIYLVPHLRIRGRAFEGAALSRAVGRCRDAGVRCGVALPPVTPDPEMDRLPGFIRALDPVPDAWIAGNAGHLALLREASPAALMTDSLFNVFNGSALELLRREGVRRVSLSPEISLGHLQAMERPHAVEVEFAVHGPVQAMFTEDCLLRIALDRQYDPGACRHYCDRASFALENEARERFPLLVTRRCRNALFFERDLCLLHRVGGLLAAGAASLRLNLHAYAPEDGGRVVRIYRKALDRALARDRDWLDEADLAELEKISAAGLWEGASGHGVVPFPAIRGGSTPVREQESAEGSAHMQGSAPAKGSTPASGMEEVEPS